MRIENGRPEFYRPDGDRVRRAPETNPPESWYVEDLIDRQMSKWLQAWDLAA